MDCRRFRDNLEDYLQGGMDFPGRFGMERHAEQCLHCGRDVAEAQKLGQLSRALSRVKAPPNFEARLLAEIRGHRIRRGRKFWRYWEYSLEWLSWRSAAVAGSIVAVFLVAVLTGTQWLSTTNSENGRFAAAPEGAPATPIEATLPATAPPQQSGLPPYRPVARYAGLAPELEPVIRVEPAAPDFVEFTVPGPGDRQFIMRLPKAVRMQYETSSEEYFIRNVSH